MRRRKSSFARPWLVVLGMALVLLAFRPHSVGAVESWEIEARLGGAWNAPLPIRLRQQGQDDLELTARWNTKSFEQPLYYGARLSAWGGVSGWALDLVHHKLHLDDPPPEVQSLAISHGYNLVTVQRLETRGHWRYGAGLGVVVAHPESEVRGRKLDEHRGLFRSGYYISGATGEAHLGAFRGLGKRLVGIVEARLTLSYASVPIADGDARVPNLAIHAAAGLGWKSWSER